MSDIDLSKLGPAARERPEPTLRGALAAAAGVLAVAGLVIIAGDAYFPDQSKLVPIVCGLVAVAVGYGVVIKLDPPVRPAGVAMITLGTLFTVVAIFDDIDSITLPLVLLAIAWGAQYGFGPARGELPLLVGALISLWVLVLDAAESDSSSVDAEAIFATPDTPITSSDDLVAYLSLGIGLLLLLAARALDKDGWHGAATGAVIVGDLAFLVGVFGVVGTLDSDEVGSLVVIAAGVVLAAIGAAGDRRFTTWLGGAGVFVGLIAFLSTIIEPDEPVMLGLAAIVVGVLIVAGILLLDPARQNREQTSASTPETGAVRAVATPDATATQPGTGATVDSAAGVPVDSDPTVPIEPVTSEPEPEPAASDIPAGWHPDPHGRHEMRWWDGSAWTANVSNGGDVTTDPEGA